jgi:hypothetical protein
MLAIATDITMQTLLRNGVTIGTIGMEDVGVEVVED